MTKKYIIGVDAGSQSSKVIIFDTSGNVISEGKQSLKPLHVPKPGIAEHPDDDLWDSIVHASKAAMKNFTGDVDDIIGLGLCTIRFCRCLLKKDGSLASPALSWMDKRVSKPYEHLNPEVKYVTASSGYMTHKFTGTFNDTAANYQGMWPIDTDTWQWSDNPEVLHHFNIPKAMLFDLKMPGDILGYVREGVSNLTNIPAGLPVVATANDKGVEALGTGLLSDKTAMISLGTYIASMVHGKNNPKDMTHFWTNFSAIPFDYLYESAGIRRGMWTISWFKDLFGEEILNKASESNISPEEYLNQEAASVPVGSDGLMTILDWLAPSDKPYKKGIMIGFDGRHTKAHIYRSIVEAIALTMKNNVDDMTKELQLELDNIYLSGGGANSDLMMQIFSDVFGLPAKRTEVSGAASLGSAISVAVALEVYENYEKAVENMVKQRDTFQPNREHTRFYQKLNDNVYKQIPQYTDEILKKVYSTFN